MGWDDPFSDEGAWIVPADSEAAAPFVWTTGIESMGTKRGQALWGALGSDLSFMLLLEKLIRDTD